ncbi:MAG: tyrosine-type recombinase/integrase [Phycisphaeraceae bacterium]
MASITNDGNGHRRIQFFDAKGKRNAIRLGKVSQRNAEAVKVKVEALASASTFGHTADDECLRWVMNLSDDLHAKLAKIGLVPSRSGTRLGPFIEEYLDRRHDLKPNTMKNLKQARDKLVDFFGADRDMRTINSGEAEQYQRDLLRDLGDNTVRGLIKKTRHFWKVAIKHELLIRNPFDEIPATVRANPKRYYYITREESDVVLAACPDVQWRMIFALCRFGGLRCPSEVLALRWSDIDWEASRIRVPSPKTERNEDGDHRMLPMFVELAEHLGDGFKAATDQDGFVITRYRDSNSNLRTQLHRIIERAGLKPWDKIFQNLRSTRETELVDEGFPSHVVCKWIGNSEPVAIKHYLQITDEHFERAIRRTTAGQSAAAERVAEDLEKAKKAAQNPAQQVHETRENDMQGPETKKPQAPANADTCGSFRSKSLP